jgi:hypothetical protein
MGMCIVTPRRDCPVLVQFLIGNRFILEQQEEARQPCSKGIATRPTASMARNAFASQGSSLAAHEIYWGARISCLPRRIEHIGNGGVELSFRISSTAFHQLTSDHGETRK